MIAFQNAVRSGLPATGAAAGDETQREHGDDRDEDGEEGRECAGEDLPAGRFEELEPFLGQATWSAALTPSTAGPSSPARPNAGSRRCARQTGWQACRTGTPTGWDGLGSVRVGLPIPLTRMIGLRPGHAGMRNHHQGRYARCARTTEDALRADASHSGGSGTGISVPVNPLACGVIGFASGCVPGPHRMVG
jgi:hypothetical protein